MTLNDIKSLDREWLLPREVAEILGCDPQDIRVQARVAPKMLGFPVSVIGSRVKVPREAFLKWMQGG